MRGLERFDKSLQDVGLLSVLKILSGQEGSLLFNDSSLIILVAERRRILDVLSPGRFNDRYDEFREVRVENSGTWFLKSPEFQKWMKGLSNLFIVTGMGMCPLFYLF